MGNAAVLGLVGRNKVCTNALGELCGARSTFRKPWLEERAEATLPGLRVGEVPGVYQVDQKSRGEFEDLLEKRMPRRMRAVGLVRGYDSEVLGE